jgi:hypothetical protein
VLSRSFGNHEPALTANFSGTRVYDSTRGWGRLWRWFYGVINRLTFKNFQLEKLKQSINHTHHLFQQQLILLRQNISSYENYLKQSGSGYEINESLIHPIRQQIQLWNQSTLPFIKLIRNGHCDKLNQLFKLCFGESLEYSILWDVPYSLVSESIANLIDIEGVIQGPMPLEVFKKILKNKPLNLLDSKALEKWIRKINQCPYVDKVNGALVAIVNRYLPREMDKSTQVIRLKIFLEEKGCDVFRQDDLEHLKWRNEVKNGTMLSHGNLQWEIEASIPSLKLEGDKTLIFTLKNSSKVLLIGQNVSVLGMRALRLKDFKDCAIQPASLEIYEEGRWAVMEWMCSLESRQWLTPQGNNSLHPSDLALANELSKLIERSIKQQTTPSNFCSASLMYDQNQKLRMLKPMVDKAFDFNALKEFAIACAAGNQAVLKYIMIKSGLADHPVCVFYRELIKNALEGDETSIDDMAGIYKILDPRVVEKGAILVKEMLAVRDERSLKMRQKYPYKETKLILKEVNSELMLCF